jgi:hypothetical protein
MKDKGTDQEGTQANLPSWSWLGVKSCKINVNYLKNIRFFKYSITSSFFFVASFYNPMVYMHRPFYSNCDTAKTRQKLVKSISLGSPINAQKAPL